MRSDKVKHFARSWAGFMQDQAVPTLRKRGRPYVVAKVSLPPQTPEDMEEAPDSELDRTLREQAASAKPAKPAPTAATASPQRIALGSASSRAKNGALLTSRTDALKLGVYPMIYGPMVHKMLKANPHLVRHGMWGRPEFEKMVDDTGFLMHPKGLRRLSNVLEAAGVISCRRAKPGGALVFTFMMDAEEVKSKFCVKGKK
jgi:hypothetical protein